MPWEARAAIFLKASELLRGEYRAKINASTMLNQSKTCHQAEIDSACELIDFWRFNATTADKSTKICNHPFRHQACGTQAKYAHLKASSSP